MHRVRDDSRREVCDGEQALVLCLCPGCPQALARLMLLFDDHVLLLSMPIKLLLRDGY